MSSRQENIKKLIATHERRLQKLKEQQGAFGLHTPPYISNEIEDAEAEIRKLRQELKRLGGNEDSERPASENSPEKGPESGSTYQINIGTAQGLVIGDGATVSQNFAGGGKAASSPAAGQPARRDTKARCADLAENIQETLALIKQYEEQRRLADDPKLKRRAERDLTDLREQLSAYQAEAQTLGCD